MSLSVSPDMKTFVSGACDASAKVLLSFSSFSSFFSDAFYEFNQLFKVVGCERRIM